MEGYLKSRNTEIEYDWVSYKGTGKHVFGTSYGHGRPNSIFNVPVDLFNDYVEQLSDAEKDDLYILLKSKDDKKIDSLVDKILNLID